MHMVRMQNFMPWDGKMYVLGKKEKPIIKWLMSSLRIYFKLNLLKATYVEHNFSYETIYLKLLYK